MEFVIKTDKEHLDGFVVLHKNLTRTNSILRKDLGWTSGVRSNTAMSG